MIPKLPKKPNHPANVGWHMYEYECALHYKAVAEAQAELLRQYYDLVNEAEVIDTCFVYVAYSQLQRDIEEARKG